MQGMAQYGRNGDTMMAHVAPGEMVVPPEILQRSPQVARGLGMAFADAGADIITFHPEATPSISNTIKLIKNEGKRVGLSLKPKSKIELIENYGADAVR